MNRETYTITQAAIIQYAKSIANLDLVGFVAEISRCQATAPVVDPSLFRQAAETMDKIKALARSMISVQEANAELASAVIIAAARRNYQEGVVPIVPEKKPS